MTYTMSRDYDALYDLICGGGDLLGRVQIGERKYTARIEAFHGFIYIEYHEDEKFSQTIWSVRIDMSTSALALKDECTRLSLEWLAPVDIAEVIAAGDELTKLKGALSNLILSLPPSARHGHFTMAELDHLTRAWTEATAKHRTT